MRFNGRRTRFGLRRVATSKERSVLRGPLVVPLHCPVLFCTVPLPVGARMALVYFHGPVESSCRPRLRRMRCCAGSSRSSLYPSNDRCRHTPSDQKSAAAFFVRRCVSTRACRFSVGEPRSGTSSHRPTALPSLRCNPSSKLSSGDAVSAAGLRLMSPAEVS